MKINSPADDRITVDLTKQDMLELDITYEDMDYSTIETRRVIWTLLDEAGKVLGKELDPTRRMIIEAIPKSEGGCILNFTILDSRRKYSAQKQFLKKQSEGFICEFENADTLYLAANGCKADVQSSLYGKDGKYRLMVSGVPDSRDIRLYFSEFSHVINSDKLICEHTKEHWKSIIEQDAISVLRS